MQIPAKDGKPDYATMETLISAVQKLVIKEVVLYKLTNVKAYETPKALKDYGVTHVPQSFIYLKQKND